LSDYTLNSALASGNVIINTTSSYSGNGDIVFGTSVSIGSGAGVSTLTLNADRNIDLQGTLTIPGMGSFGVFLNPGVTNSAGKVLTSSGNTLSVSGLGGPLTVEIQNGKVWDNSGIINFLNNSLLHLNDGTSGARFNNLSTGVFNLNSTSGTDAVYSCYVPI
jgi:hypothetical protein